MRAVATWKDEHTLENLAPNGRVLDFEVVLRELLDSFERFYSKDGHQKPVREAIQNWKAFAKNIEKQNRCLERAQSKRSAARGKLNSADLDEEAKPPLIDDLQLTIGHGHFLPINTSDKLADFPKKLWQCDAKKEELQALRKVANFQTQIKWVKARLAKDGADSMASQITNKKLYGSVEDVFVDMDSRVAHDSSFFIKFPAEHEQLKKAVMDYQILVMSAGYYSVNVSPFCLPEMQACTAGEIQIVGIPPSALEGETTSAKMDSLNKLSYRALAELVTGHGFATTLKEGDMCAIPPGLLVATLLPNKAIEAAVVVKYSFMQAADYEACHNALVGMLQSFEYLEGTDYGAVRRLMEASAKHKA